VRAVRTTLRGCWPGARTVILMRGSTQLVTQGAVQTSSVVGGVGGRAHDCPCDQRGNCAPSSRPKRGGGLPDAAPAFVGALYASSQERRSWLFARIVDLNRGEGKTAMLGGAAGAAITRLALAKRDTRCDRNYSAEPPVTGLPFLSYAAPLLPLSDRCSATQSPGKAIWDAGPACARDREHCR
jgi:hypothetical protein